MNEIENINCADCGGEKTVECRPEEQVSVCLECGRRYTEEDLRRQGDLLYLKARALEAYGAARKSA